MKILSKNSALLLCSVLYLTQTNKAIAAPAKQELDAFYKLEEKLLPEAGTYLDNKIKSGKNLADWYELKTFWLLRAPSYTAQELFLSARSAARQDPKNSHILVTYAIALTLYHKHQAAQEFLDRVIKADQKNARALAAQAYLFADQNTNEDLAQDEMKTAIKLAPSDPTVNHLALLFYRKMFNYGAAKGSLERWMKAYPNDLFPRMMLAELMRNARHRDETIQVCKQVIAINPKLEWARHVLMNTCYDKQDYKATADAITEMLVAIPASKQNYELFNRRAEAFKHLKQYEKALADYDSAIKILAPSTKDRLPAELPKWHEKIRRMILQNWIGRAEMHVKTGKPQDASKELTQVLSFYPSNSGALQIRAQAWEAQKKYDLALIDIDTLIKKDSDVPDWYKMKIAILRKMGKESDALATEERMKQVLEFGTR